MTVSQLYKLTVTLRVRRQLRSHECKLLRIPRTRIKDGSRAECRSISAPRAVVINIIQDDVVSWLFMRSSARVDFMRPAKAALIMHIDLMPRRVFDICVLNIQARPRPPSFQIIAWSWICLRLYIPDPSHLHPQYCNWVAASCTQWKWSTSKDDKFGTITTKYNQYRNKEESHQGYNSIQGMTSMDWRLWKMKKSLISRTYTTANFNLQKKKERHCYKMA